MARHNGCLNSTKNWNKPVTSVYIRSEISRKFLNTVVRCGDAFIGSRAVGTCIQVSFPSTITRLRGFCRNSSHCHVTFPISTSSLYHYVSSSKTRPVCNKIVAQFVEILLYWRCICTRVRKLASF